MIQNWVTDLSNIEGEGWSAQAIRGYLRIPSQRRQVELSMEGYLAALLNRPDAELINGLESWGNWLCAAAAQLAAESESHHGKPEED